MSRRVWLAAAAAIGFVAACGGPKNTAGPADVAQLLATDREWGAIAAVSKNADSISGYWTDGAHVVMAGQPTVSGKPAIHAMVAGMLNIPGFHITWTPDSAIVSRSGELGYTYGSNAITLPDSAGRPVTTRGRYLTVWRKDADGRWRCVEDYSTPAPAGPP